jgi:hypothetical protein
LYRVVHFWLLLRLTGFERTRGTSSILADSTTVLYSCKGPHFATVTASSNFTERSFDIPSPAIVTP